MTGQMSIYDWLANMAAVQEEKEPPTVPQGEPDRPQEVMIRQGTKWETVTYAQALEWARKKWTKLRGVQEPYRAQYINAHYVRGVDFENDELKGA